MKSACFDYNWDGDLDMYLLTNDMDGVEKTSVNPAAYRITRGVTADKLYEILATPLGIPFVEIYQKMLAFPQKVMVSV